MYLLLRRKCETENYNMHCCCNKKHGFLQVMQEIMNLFFQSKILISILSAFFFFFFFFLVELADSIVGNVGHCTLTFV